MTDNESELRAEVVTFRCKEAYLYSVPPASTIGHRAETWNVDKWLQVVPAEIRHFLTVISQVTSRDQSSS